MKKNYHLLLIDPQNDFCDLPATYLMSDPASGESVIPALAVPGAHADMQRVAQLIRQGGAGLSAISITLDSHHRYDIAHPGFWVNQDQQPVTPFTQISASAVRARQFLPRDQQALPRVLDYLDALEKNARYQLMVWPVHCEIGSWGQCVHVDVRAAYNHWEDVHCTSVQKMTKGANPWTEHYSALMAEVPDANDPETQLNQQLLQSLRNSDRVYIAGEAGSHCVKASAEHIVENLSPTERTKLVLVTDGMSPVAGFEDVQTVFLSDMQARGVRLATAAEVLAELMINSAS